MDTNQFPRDIAEAVRAELRKRASTLLKLEVLVDLFESMYFASLKTEESQTIVFHVVYLDPDNPDPNPPERIVKDRWSYVRLAKSIPATIPNLIKIAKASDPRTSSLAIYPNNDGRLSIWGLIDQGNRYHDYVNYDTESGAERPGIFQASIAGAGHLIAYMGFWKIAELKTNLLLRNAFDVFAGGPVREMIEPGIQSYVQRVKGEISEYIYSDRPHWESSLSSYWISSLCRLLLRVQNYHHGGAILITPDNSFAGLNIKYGIDYARLRVALDARAIATIQETFAADKIFEGYLDKDADEVPVDLYLDETVSSNQVSESRSELDSTIWFISLLSRVDGLVLLNPNLEVKGFGVEITYSEEPSSVFVAGNRNGTKKGLRKVDYNHYGTRHRSMMRYCAQVPGSLGFVISQDGDVRVITQVSSQAIMWDNIKLQQHHYFVRRKKKQRKGISAGT
ncbi:MAG: putative sensor domain DACNV-containing protein [Pyrinomonadaceae bacterium]